MTDVIYDPMAGEQIDRAVTNALIKAQEVGGLCTFTFNGVTLTVGPTSPIADVIGEFHRISERKHREWVESPEYRKIEAETKARVRQDQEQTNLLLRELDGVIGDEPALVAWIGKFADCTQWRDIRFDHEILAARLEAAGYVDGFGVGNDALSTDPGLMAGYIVGQAIANLRCEVHRFHPILARFAEEYREAFRNGR